VTRPLRRALQSAALRTVLLAIVMLPLQASAQAGGVPPASGALGWPGDDLPEVRISSVAHIEAWLTNEQGRDAPAKPVRCTATLISADPRSPDRPELAFLVTAAHCVMPDDRHQLGVGACVRRIDVHGQSGHVTLLRRSDRDSVAAPCDNETLTRFDDFAVHLHSGVAAERTRRPRAAASSVLSLGLISAPGDEGVADALRREEGPAAGDLALISIDRRGGRMSPEDFTERTGVSPLRFDPEFSSTADYGAGVAYPCEDPSEPDSPASITCRRVNAQRAFIGPRLVLQRTVVGTRMLLTRDPDDRSTDNGATERERFRAGGWDALRPSQIDSGGGFFVIDDEGPWPGWTNVRPDAISRRRASLSGVLSRAALSGGALREIYVGRAPISEGYCAARASRGRRRYCGCMHVESYRQIDRQMQLETLQTTCSAHGD
jgi:hypothetical protein